MAKVMLPHFVLQAIEIKLLLNLTTAITRCPEFIAATSIQVGTPFSGNVPVWDDDLTADWGLSAANGWKTEIVLEAAGGCEPDIIPVFVSDGTGGELELVLVPVYLRLFDIGGDGFMALEDWTTFGQSYGNCGDFECAGFVPDGCVDAANHSAFGQHYSHSNVGTKSQAVLTPLLDASSANAQLMPCYPNPFNPMTNIEFSLAKPGEVFLGIYDVQGRLVNTIVDESRSAGLHRVTWDGTDRDGGKVASGMYFYRMSALGESYTNSMVLMK